MPYKKTCWLWHDTSIHVSHSAGVYIYPLYVRTRSLLVPCLSHPQHTSGHVIAVGARCPSVRLAMTWHTSSPRWATWSFWSHNRKNALHTVYTSHIHTWHNTIKATYLWSTLIQGTHITKKSVQPTDDKLSLIGAWSGHVTHYKILGAPIISLEWLNLKSSNFVHE